MRLVALFAETAFLWLSIAFRVVDGDLWSTDYQLTLKTKLKYNHHTPRNT